MQTLRGGNPQRYAGFPRAGEVAFSQGVASGQPTCRGITLWTRAAGLERDSRLELEVARDPGFRKVIVRRDVIAEERRNFTVLARVSGGGLRPGEQYFYASPRARRTASGDASRPPCRRTRESRCGSVPSRARLTTRALHRPRGARCRGRPRPRRLSRGLHLREGVLRGAATALGHHRRQPGW